MSRRQQIVAVLAVLLMSASAVTIVAQRQAPNTSAETTPEVTLEVPVEATTDFAPEATPESTLEPVNLAGLSIAVDRLSFTLPFTVANGYDVARSAPIEARNRPFVPTVTRVEFVDYLPDDSPELTHDFAVDPGVWMYATVELQAARDTDPAYADAPERLAALIQSRDALSAEAVLPFLPLRDVTPVLHAREQYVQLRGGTGILYLAAFAEPNVPLVEGDVALVFQGLSDDGALYIAAVFPLDTNYLPSAPPENLDAVAFEAGYDLYVQSIRAALNEFQPSASGPRLNDLYALIASMEIAP
ncbi:MAG: hypothetical protein IPM16_20905 [Chloroflexi bacterium]|nr:hypothetical protein [Chloroflexota bacterium]